MQFTNCMSVCKNKLLTLQKWEKMQYESISVYQFILVLFRAWSIHRKFFKTYPALRQYKGEFIEGTEAIQREKKYLESNRGCCFTTFTQIFHAIQMFFQNSDRKASGKKSF